MFYTALPDYIIDYVPLSRRQNSINEFFQY